MNYTKDDIQKLSNGLIDFTKMAKEIELDLNIIAEEVMKHDPDYPQNEIQFLVFNDFELYNRHIELQAAGEGNGFLKTPVMLHRMGGSFDNEKGSRIYAVSMLLEAYGFLHDKDNLYKIFNVLAELKHGKIITIPSADQKHGGKISQVFHLPTFGNQIQDGGMSRLEIGQEFSYTYIYDGIVFNEVEITLNDNPIDIIQFDLNRSRAIGAGQKNNETETKVVNKSQSLVLSLVSIYDATPASKLVFNNIRKLGSDMNQPIDISIAYPGETPDNYRMVIVDGSISGLAGGYLVLSCVLNLAPIKR